MPTPFMHLQIAEQIRSELEARPGSDGRLLCTLLQAWPAFYLGSVAADYQTITQVPREATHFYTLPPDPDNQAYPEMLACYPELADATALPPTQGVFVAAYCAHLMLDLIWFRRILLPFFAGVSDLGSREQRRLLHDVLLTYLDKLAFDALPATAGMTLAAAQPDHWLPFADDADLVRWRDMLAAQLQPGGKLQTIEIYAGRLGMSPAAFAANLNDPTWMSDYLFAKIPVAEVQTILASAVPQSITLLTDYLKTGG